KSIEAHISRYPCVVFAGPTKWPSMFPACRGSRQSPIALSTSTAKTTSSPHLMWWNYSLYPRTMKLTNNGHTGTVAVLTARWQRNDQVPYHRAGSASEYVFEQLHFHWGEGRSGSEHSINNQQFSLELHAVHYKRGFRSVAQARRYEDGIRVIAILYRMSALRQAYTGLQEIVPYLKTVRQAHTSTALSKMFPLVWLIPTFQNGYFTYNGSLTAPPCTESVSWIVHKSTLTVASRQLQEFRTLKNQHGRPLTRNIRHPQPLHGRTVIQVV
ncbi:carbonic anhydrase 1-like, partial [Periplaneta americana]|uniref:carbonic anhydrase 1-like n=1 Tax=Periplaneta americana TaxID=6978 RepID=UPI0037E8003B